MTRAKGRDRLRQTPGVPPRGSARATRARERPPMQLAGPDKNKVEKTLASSVSASNHRAIARLYEIGKRCIGWGDRFDENLLEMLDAAIWITRAEKGNVQLFDDAALALRIAVQRGFEAPFLDFFRSVDCDEASVCGVALAARQRVVVEDVRGHAIFVGQPSLQVLLDANVQAVQSTPLVSSRGTVLGMISTHFSRPHQPSAREFRLLDLLARQVADYVERRRGEAERDELLRTAQTAQREAEAADRAKDEFLAMLGHELRNPLSAVRNALAAATFSEANRPRALAIARRATDQLGRIVDDLLDVARMTQGSIRLRKAPLSLGTLLQQTADGVQGLMHDRGHSLTVVLPPEDVRLDADASRIEQAIANVLTNAAKYTDPGGKVTLTLEQSPGQAIIRVCDTGVGIAPDVLPRVFDMFTQGERSLDRAQGGLGIGLTLVRRIVELHGGSVEAQSSGVGAGTEFVIRLPTTRAGGGELVPTEEPQRRAPTRKPARVIVVEDNPEAAESLVMVLELLGHVVRVVHHGPAAIEAAHADAPDVMLIDIGLPEMNGYEVAQVIRGDTSLRHLALIALTGYGEPKDRARAMAAGFDDHVVKPVDLDVLGELVERVASPAKTKARSDIPC
jgi:signal transduction histidine kinase/ActR/RegA family two-component response regulator